MWRAATHASANCSSRNSLAMASSPFTQVAIASTSYRRYYIAQDEDRIQHRSITMPTDQDPLALAAQAAAAPVPPSRRRRKQRYTRSRTGCLTCRRRKVKCDEVSLRGHLAPLPMSLTLVGPTMQVYSTANLSPLLRPHVLTPGETHLRKMR